LLEAKEAHLQLEPVAQVAGNTEVEALLQQKTAELEEAGSRMKERQRNYVTN
jgi:hypothetical protein